MTALTALHKALSASLIERDAEISAILRGLVAGEHVLLVGPPGTAKSHLCRSVAAAISGCRYVERLLSPTTPPEAVFGPISLSALREDRYEHVGTGTVTDAELVFFDEFFRGSDAIRDTLLHLLGPERQALVGSKQVKAPLLCAVGAANTWSDSTDQAAILDRWLIRRTVRYVSPAGRERLLYEDLPSFVPQPTVRSSTIVGAITGDVHTRIEVGKTKPPTLHPVCTLADIQYAQGFSSTLPVTPDAKASLVNILDELQAAGIRPSDRRCRQSLKVARAEAVLCGDKEVQPGHLECLSDVLWDDPHDQPEKATEIITRIANPVGAKVNALLAEVDQIVGDVGSDAAKRMAAIKKLEESEKAATKLAAEAGANGRAAKALAYVKNERVRLQAAALGIDPAKMTALLGGK